MQNRVTVLLQQPCCCESTMHFSSYSYAVMLTCPRLRLYDDLRRHPSATILSKPKHILSPLYNPAANWLQEGTDQLQWWRTCREAHACCPSGVELWESAWMAEISTAISQLFIDRIQPLKWAHLHSKTVSQEYNHTQTSAFYLWLPQPHKHRDAYTNPYTKQGDVMHEQHEKVGAKLSVGPGAFWVNWTLDFNSVP